jgi:uncharacterized membrane protein YdjX (TVP38/TMEM64 family)
MRFAKIWPWCVVGALLVLGILWQWSPLHARFSLTALENWGRTAQASHKTAIWVLLAYTLGGLLAFPHGLMIWATSFLFSPAMAIAYAELGTLCSGVAVYCVGRAMSRSVAERITGPKLASLREGFANKAVVSIILLHIFPIMPFSVLNLAAGSSEVKFWDFIVGTALGVTPGILAVCFFGHQLLRIIHHPNALDIAVLIVFVGVGFFLLRWLRKKIVR